MHTTFGERLRRARKSKGITQEVLATTIGVSRGVIFNLEKEKNKGSVQQIVLNAICKTLNINEDWLVHGTGDMENSSEACQSAKTLIELYDVAKGLSEPEQLFILDTIKSLKTRLSGE